MTVSITPLARSLVQGSIPKSGPSRMRTLHQVFEAAPHTWARTRQAMGAHGHPIFQLLSIPARQLGEWNGLCGTALPHEYHRIVRDWLCTVQGGAAWAKVEENLRMATEGQWQQPMPIQVVENHANQSPETTRLVVCDLDYSVWATLALLDRPASAWVGFSAVLHEELRWNGRPSMCGLTAELARKLN